MSKLDNPEVKKAMKLVEEILSDPKEREILDAREIARLDYNSDISYAEEKGLKRRKDWTERKSGVTEERKRNAKKMKEMELSDEQICKILNLTIDELKELI